jgi:hypothetical protein
MLLKGRIGRIYGLNFGLDGSTMTTKVGDQD